MKTTEISNTETSSMDDQRMLADSPVNPFKGAKCNYVYDYCNSDNCNCMKSYSWERKHNPYHDWITYSLIKPPIGVEVLAQSDEWISEDYNKKGIRLGFQNENDNGDFVNAKWNNSSDEYETIEDSKPTRWRFF